jgi:polyisoprenoid-binding protein YceI
MSRSKASRSRDKSICVDLRHLRKTKHPRSAAVCGSTFPGLASHDAWAYIAEANATSGVCVLPRIFAAGVVLSFGLAAQALAQPAPRPVPPPAAAQSVPAGAWQIVPAHTRVVFSVGRFPFGDYYGQFVGATGQLQFDPKDPAASRLEVRIPIAGLESESAGFTGALEGPGWFDAARFPVMTFRSRAITLTGPATADVAGDLTLHGVTRLVVFKATFNVAGVSPLDKAWSTGFEVRGVIRRREFGVTRYEPFISDDVRIVISAAFERAPS